MIEYDVTITERPLGVRFAHADRGKTVVVHLVLENKVGHRLGLLPGDILLAVKSNSVTEMTSTEALQLFRSQPLPFKASFRRFEDDDDFDSDGNSSDGDLQSQFQAEDANALLYQLECQATIKSPTKQAHQIIHWSVDNVQDWLIKYGTSMGDKDRFVRYQKVFAQNKINGYAMHKLEKVDLAKIGVSDFDCQDLYLGIQELNRIFKGQQQHPYSDLAIYQHTEYGNDQLLLKEQKAAREKQKKQKNNNNNNNNGNEDDNKDEEDDELEDNDDEEDEEESSDNWEAPFLPYMYDAPQIKLSEKTVVKVYTARVVAPFKKRPFALYELEVNEGKEEWLLSKRYSEFYRLFEAMKKLGVQNVTNKFPKKGLFKKSVDKQVMEDRKKKLTLYLNELLELHSEARNSKELSDFLSPSRTFVVDE